MMKYKLKRGLKKTVLSLAFVVLPYVILKALEFYPELGALTVAAIASMFVNWLKNKNNNK